ncbi:hypothetical protein K1X76_09275 [bacterium]|nr:hypothetical protein [bacterium]
MKNVFHILKTNKGFSIIEAVLTISIMSLMFGVASQAMISNLSTYAFISNRQAALSDMRYAMNLVTNELTRLSSANIQSISATSITFRDINGNNATYSSSTQNGVTSLMKNNEKLASPISGFTLAYLDQNGNTTAAISSVRKIKVTMTSAQKDNEGNISLTTMIIPRNFLYSNYQ